MMGLFTAINVLSLRPLTAVGRDDTSRLRGRWNRSYTTAPHPSDRGAVRSAVLRPGIRPGNGPAP